MKSVEMQQLSAVTMTCSEKKKKKKKEIEHAVECLSVDGAHLDVVEDVKMKKKKKKAKRKAKLMFVVSKAVVVSDAAAAVAVEDCQKKDEAEEKVE